MDDFVIYFWMMHLFKKKGVPLTRRRRDIYAIIFHYSRKKEFNYQFNFPMKFVSHLIGADPRNISKDINYLVKEGFINKIKISNLNIIYTINYEKVEQAKRRVRKLFKDRNTLIPFEKYVPVEDSLFNRVYQV